MKKELITKDVIEIIENFSCLNEELSTEAKISDIGLDSLDMVEITMELEERFDVSIEDEEIANVKTVSDIVELVIAKKAD